jgi:hypothetical protein
MIAEDCREEKPKKPKTQQEKEGGVLARLGQKRGCNHPEIMGIAHLAG